MTNAQMHANHSTRTTHSHKNNAHTHESYLFSALSLVTASTPTPKSQNRYWLGSLLFLLPPPLRFRLFFGFIQVFIARHFRYFISPRYKIRSIHSIFPDLRFSKFGQKKTLPKKKCILMLFDSQHWIIYESEQQLHISLMIFQNKNENKKNCPCDPNAPKCIVQNSFSRYYFTKSIDLLRFLLLFRHSLFIRERERERENKIEKGRIIRKSVWISLVSFFNKHKKESRKKTDEINSKWSNGICSSICTVLVHFICVLIIEIEHVFLCLTKGKKIGKIYLKRKIYMYFAYLLSVSEGSQGLESSMFSLSGPTKQDDDMFVLRWRLCGWWRCQRISGEFCSPKNTIFLHSRQISLDLSKCSVSLLRFRFVSFRSITFNV